MAEYELSRTLSKYLDRHLVFPLLEFLQGKGIYEEVSCRLRWRRRRRRSIATRKTHAPLRKTI